MQKLARNTKLKEVAEKTGFTAYIAKNPCQKGEVSQETGASTVEAVVGAVYLDSKEDMNTARKVLQAMDFYETT